MIDVKTAPGHPPDASGSNSAERGRPFVADSVLATKLFVPPSRRDLVPRPELMERLSHVLETPVTVVVAPAGWGKTSLLSAWHGAGGAPIAWLSLDPGDNDLHRFWRTAIIALQTLESGVGTAALRSLQSPRLPPGEVVATSLINDLAELSRDVVLVLDDYHAVEETGIHRSLAFVLDRLPPQVHVVIATRTDPPLPLARWRARGRLTEVRTDDLRFSATEVTGLLNDTMQLGLSEDDITALHACTEGWAAGLHLAGLSLRDRDREERHRLVAMSRGANRYILDYLADEVFNAQPEEIRRFLLHTSILDRLSGPLCDALVEPPGDASATDGQTMLEQIENANLFLVPLDADRTWYRYHHLFAAFLRRRLGRAQPEVVPALHRRAGTWLVDHGMPAAAVEHALEAEDHEQAARLIEGLTQPIIWERGELSTVLRWVERLPREVAGARPRLCLDLAWALLWSARTGAIEPQLRDVENALTRNPGTWPDNGHRTVLGEVAAIRAELARQRGEIEEAIDLARSALADLPEGERVARGAAAGLLASASILSGDLDAAQRGYAEAGTQGESPEAMLLGLIAGGRLVMVQALQGRLHEAEATYRQTLHRASRHGISPSPAIGVAQVGMAEVLRTRNDLAEAEDLARQGIDRCRSWAGLAEMALDGSLTLAGVLRARGDVGGALAALEDAEAAGRENSVPLAGKRVALARARIRLAIGDEAGALSCLQSANSGHGRPGYIALLERLLRARVALARADVDAAGAALQEALPIAETGGFTGHVIEVLVLQAIALQRGGQMPDALIALTRALALGEREGHIRPLADEGPLLLPLLRTLVSRGRRDTYTKRVLQACEDGNETPPRVLVEPLSARELELLRSLAAGLSTPEIASRHFITTGTVRNHLKSIFGKLDVHSRLQAVEVARSLRLV